MTPDHHYHVKTELDRMNLFAEIGITDYDKGDIILNLLASTGKIDNELWEDNNVIVSPDLLESLKDAYLKRNNDIIKIDEIRVKYTGNPSHTEITAPLEVEETPENEDNEGDNPQRIGKDRKGKEIKEVKHKYGEYSHVLITDTEYSKLKEEWGEGELNRMIKILDEGIESKGYKYTNHYLALRNWKKNDKGTPIPKSASIPKQNMKCPECSGKVEFGQCVQCGTIIGLDGKVVL
jgi:hypothetical protein